ncbi:hypothetical protein IH94_23440 [Salmonella enterica]|nr:hypothetical protein [Salmonella enterica]EIY7072895.1 hypothetical protein [Salmonella enterica]
MLWLPPGLGNAAGQVCDERLAPVNAKRVYWVMSEKNLLLLHDRLQCTMPVREHNSKVEAICAGADTAATMAKSYG